MRVFWSHYRLQTSYPVTKPLSIFGGGEGVTVILLYGISFNLLCNLHLVYGHLHWKETPASIMQNSWLPDASLSTLLTLDCICATTCFKVLSSKIWGS